MVVRMDIDPITTQLYDSDESPVVPLLLEFFEQTQ